MMLSDVCVTSVCLSVTYIGPKSRTERPRKTKIGTEIANVTCDSDTTFKVKRSKVKVTKPYWLPVQVTIYMDDNIVYATAQSEQLPVELGAAYRGISWRPPAFSLLF